MKRLLLLFAALLMVGCSSSSSSGGGASASGSESASLELRLQLPEQSRQARAGELASLIIRVVDADRPELDVISPVRVDLTGVSGTIVRRIPDISPGRRRVTAQAFNAEGGVELIGDSGVVVFAPTELVPITLALHPPDAAHLSFVTQPSNTLVSTAIAPDVSVELVDALGQRLTSSSAAVTLSLNGAANLGGTLTVTTVNGLATFPGLTVDTPGSGYTLQASAPGVSGGVSSPFDVAASVTAPTQLAFAVQPVATTQNLTLPAVQVTLLDASGVVVPTANAPVTLALGSNPGGSTLGGTLTVNAVNGVATFSDLSLSQPGLGYTLIASSPGLTDGVSAAFNITAAFSPPTQLAFSIQPATSQARAPLGTVEVQVQDASGTTVTTANNAVTLALGTNPGPATLGGTLTVNAVNGVATFSNVILSKSGTGYTLDASATGLTGATSNPFDQGLPHNALTLVPGQPFGPFNNPLRGAITPDGQFLYMTESFNPGDILGFNVDGSTGALTQLLASPFVGPGIFPGGFAITPDGQFAYASSKLGDNIRFYTITAGNLVAAGNQTTAVGSGPLGLTVTPAGGVLFAALNLLGQLESLASPIPPALTPVNAASVGGPAFPSDVYLNPAGDLAFVNTGDVYTVTPGTHVVTLVPGSPFGVTGANHGAALNPAGTRFYSGDDSPSTLFWIKDINPATGVMTDIPGSPFTLSSVAHRVAFSPDGLNAYTFDDNGDVHIWDVDATDGHLTEIDDSPVSPGVGTFPSAIVTDPQGRFLYESVSNFIAAFQFVP